MNNPGFTILSNLPAMILPLFILALLVIGVVRSGGLPRILLAIAAGFSLIQILLIPFLPMLFESLGAPIVSLFQAVPRLAEGVLLGVALIIGRPGYLPSNAHPTYPGQPGSQPHQL